MTSRRRAVRSKDAERARPTGKSRFEEGPGDKEVAAAVTSIQKKQGAFMEAVQELVETVDLEDVAVGTAPALRKAADRVRAALAALGRDHEQA